MANWRDRATRVPSLSHSQSSSMSRPANFMFFKPGWLESPAPRHLRVIAAIGRPHCRLRQQGSCRISKHFRRLIGDSLATHG